MLQMWARSPRRKIEGMKPILLSFSASFELAQRFGLLSSKLFTGPRGGFKN